MKFCKIHNRPLAPEEDCIICVAPEQIAHRRIIANFSAYELILEESNPGTDVWNTVHFALKP